MQRPFCHHHTYSRSTKKGREREREKSPTGLFKLTKQIDEKKIVTFMWHSNDVFNYDA